MKYFSMFSGVEGFGLGIERAYEEIQNARPIQQEDSRPRTKPNRASPQHNSSIGAECIGFSEIDKFASQVLKYHYPNIKNYGDARTIDARTLPDFDLLTGGFPCQTFSIAGKRKGFEDTRGTLFFEMARIAKEKKPKYWLAENVKGLVSHDGGKTLKVILAAMQEIGYTISYEILNAKNYGVPQNRERIFILGYHIPTICKEILRDGIRKKTDTSAQIIKGFLFQTLLNNLEEAKKLQETESKDSVLGLLLLNAIIRVGQKEKLIFLNPTSKNLYENLAGCSPTELKRRFTIKPGNLVAKPNISDGTLFTDENISRLDTEELWRSIGILLSPNSEENSLDPKQSTILTAISQTTTKETFTYAEMLRTIVYFTLHLRNSSSPLWNEVLSDLIIIKENTKYEPITNQNQERIIARSGFVRRANLPAALREHAIVECGFREESPPEVFFEPRTDGKDMEQLVGGAQGHRLYDPKGIAQTQNSGGGGLGAKTGLYLMEKFNGNKNRRSKKDSERIIKKRQRLLTETVKELNAKRGQFGEHYNLVAPRQKSPNPQYAHLRPESKKKKCQEGGVGTPYER